MTSSLQSGGLRLRFVPGPDGRLRFVTDVLGLDGEPVAAIAAECPGRGRPRSRRRSIEADGEACAWPAAVVAGDPTVDRPTTSGRATSGRALVAVSRSRRRIDLAGPLLNRRRSSCGLAMVPTMADRQTHSFRRTFVAGPVRSTQGLAGNSVPAAYLFDPVTGLETILHVDAGRWPGRPVACWRWSCESCSTTVHRRGTASGSCRPRVSVPGRAARLPLAALAEPPRRRTRQLAGECPARRHPGGRLRRRGTASRPGRDLGAGGRRGASDDLLDADQSQVSLSAGGEDVLGLRAYVRDATHYYDRRRDHVELMTVADVVPPLLLYLRLHPDAEAAGPRRRPAGGRWRSSTDRAPAISRTGFRPMASSP